MQKKQWIALGGGGMSCLIVLTLLTARVHENPPVDPAATIESRIAVPAHVASALRRACFDCHSNQTRWPWYSQIPPGVWMVAHDVERARVAMNFSDWPDPMARLSRAPGLLLAACAGLRSQRMPPERYLLLHPEARLTPSEIDAVCDWSRTQAARIAAARRNHAKARLSEESGNR